MISAFINAFKIPELKKRILFTLGIIILTRVGASIPVPGVDPAILNDAFKMAEEKGGGFLTMLTIFAGGAMENCAIFSLTIMPYISASIIFQLLTAVIPQLSKISREEGGRQKITQYTRYLTILIAIFQSYLLANVFQDPARLSKLLNVNLHDAPVANPGWQFVFTTVVALTAGTVFLMWLGEQITERGIGNGISMLIASNILAKFLPAIALAYEKLFLAPDAKDKPTIIYAIGFVSMFLGVIAAVIVVTQAQRKVAVQYAQRMVGRKVYGGGQNYMPLKVNYSGVMPIIFAQAILMFPKTIAEFVQVPWLSRLTAFLYEGHIVYMAVYSLMIFFFSYFWVATVFNPIQIADDLKKHGGYIPGVRPGRPTAEFLDYTMTRITFAGAIFLTFLAIVPIWIAQSFSINQLVASFFGGTSLLIIVGVLLDMLRQIETHLLNRNYEGFLRKGRMKGRI